MGPETSQAFESIDPFQFLNDLLRQCVIDFDEIYSLESPVNCLLRRKTTNCSFDNEFDQIYNRVTDHLNNLVLWSPRIFSKLQNAANLRQPTLVAVYRVLSLALWCSQRAIRCAGLRCLRYYVRTKEDVDIFLDNRLDLYITRCLDLSYAEEFLAPLCVADCNDSSTLDERIPKTQPIQHLAGPYRRFLEDPKRGGRNIGFQRPFRKSCSPTSATDATERMSVLRLAAHLLRLSERAFTADLVHGFASAVSANSAPPRPIGVAYPLTKAGEDAGPPPQPIFSPLTTKFNSGRERDSCLRAYLLLLTEFVLRSSATWVPNDSTLGALSRCSPLKVAVQTLIGALPCSGEPGEIYKHPALLLESILFALLRFSAESSLGRRVVDSWVFQKCIAPYLITYPMVTVPRSPYDSNPSFIAATRDSFVFIFRSWSGLFYFLREGQQCLHTLMQSLLFGSSKLRTQVLSILYNLFPGVSAPAPITPANDTAHTVMGDFSSALYTGLPYPPIAYRHRGHQENKSQLQQIVVECLPPFPYLDGDFVVEEGLRLYPFVQSAGTDILEAHSALVLSCLAQAGLFEALIAAVDDPSLYVAAAAGQLLGILAFKTNTQLHPESLCVERLANIPLFHDRFRAVDFIDRVNQKLTERVYAGPRPKLRAPLVSPFIECLSRHAITACSTLSPIASRINGTSSGRSSDTRGYASLIQKAPASLKAAVLFQRSDNLLERVITSCGVCSAPAVTVSTSTAQASAPVASASTLGKSVSQASHASFFTSPSNIPLTSSMASPYEWDWEVLASWARRLSSSGGLVFSWKDQNSQTFLTRLMDFFTPNLEVLKFPMDIAYPSGSSPLYPILFKTSKQEDCFPLSPDYIHLLNRRTISSATSSSTTVLQNLSWTSRNWSQAWAAAIVIAGVLPHLSLYSQSSFPGSQLCRFLTAIRACLLAAIAPKSSPVASCTHLLLQPNHLREHCSGLLLLGLGCLLSCETGSALLHSMGISDLLIALSVGEPKERDFQALKHPDSVSAVRKQRLLCAKILLSSISYSGSGFGRSLLATVCSSGHVALRLWATKFIRLLVRINVPSAEVWLVPLLLNLSSDRNQKIMHEAVSVLEEACLNPAYLQSLMGCIQTENRQNSKRCCSAFPSPVLRLLSIGSLASQRVVAFLLAKSAWMFKIASTPKLFTSRPPLCSAHPRGTIEGTLLEAIVRAWMEFYNEEFVKSIENAILNSFRLPLSPHCRSPLSTPATNSTYLQRCPVCNQPLNLNDHNQTQFPDADNTTEDAEDNDLFLNRQSNRFFMSHLGDPGGGECGLREDEAVELSPAAIQLFYQNRASLYVPLHLFYCLATQEAGFRILRDNGYLTTLADVLSQARSLTCDGSKGQPTVVQVKAAIWALASVLVTPNGTRWKQAPAVLQNIFWIIANADSLSLRGMAWLSMCFVASTPSGGALLQPWTFGDTDTSSESNSSIGSNWLLSITDRTGRIWPLRERPVLRLKIPLLTGSVMLGEGGDTGLSSALSNRSSVQGRSFVNKNVSKLHQANPHHNMFSLRDTTDANFLSPGAPIGSSPLTTASPSAHSASSTITDPRWSRPMDHLLRPVRWIARRAAVSFRGGHRGGRRSTKEIDLSVQLDLEDIVDGIETSFVRGEWERTASTTSIISGRITVHPGSTSVMVQSLSSPGWFSAFDPIIDSRSVSVLPGGRPMGANNNGSPSGLTDIFVFRGLFLPADVSALGRNFFPREVPHSPKPISLPVSGESSKLTNGDLLSGGMNKKSTNATSNDNTQRLCISAACRSAKFICPQTCEDSEVLTWRHDVVEEVENLMDGLLLGRALANLLALTRRAVAFSSSTSVDAGEKDRHSSFASACLHAEVARILFNYHYSRPARTLVQLFLGQFPPSDELLNDAETALEEFCESVSLESSADPPSK